MEYWICLTGFPTELELSLNTFEGIDVVNSERRKSKRDAWEQTVYSVSVFHIQMELSLQLIPLESIQLAQFSDKHNTISVMVNLVLKFFGVGFLMFGEGGYEG